MYYILKNLNTGLYYNAGQWYEDPSDARHYTMPTPPSFDRDDNVMFDVMTFIQVFRPADD